MDEATHRLALIPRDTRNHFEHCRQKETHPRANYETRGCVVQAVQGITGYLAALIPERAIRVDVLDEDSRAAWEAPVAVILESDRGVPIRRLCGCQP